MRLRDAYAPAHHPLALHFELEPVRENHELIAVADLDRDGRRQLGPVPDRAHGAAQILE
jgi:hypothetical protein